MICIIKSRTAYFIKFIGAQNNKKPARRLVCLVSCVCFCHIDCTTSVRKAGGEFARRRICEECTREFAAVASPQIPRTCPSASTNCLPMLANYSPRFITIASPRLHATALVAASRRWFPGSFTIVKSSCIIPSSHL